MNLLESLEARDAKLLPWIRETVENWGESFGIDSENLPEEYRSKGPVTSFKSLIKRADAKKAVSAFRADKLAKMERANKYREQLERGVEIEYDVDEDKLNRKMIAFVDVMININIIELD